MHNRLSFVDLFAGCGGLSLGLLASGWQGLFAIEKDSMAFGTLKHNLVDGHSNSMYRFQWPFWLEKKNWEIKDFLAQHSGEIRKLRGAVNLVAGGPPCQGFSFAGKRNEHDPRNRLFEQYVDFIDLVRPNFLVIENVKGITVNFGGRSQTENRNAQQAEAYSEKIQRALRSLPDPYETQGRLVYARDCGVPQRRPRFILLGIRKSVAKRLGSVDPFSIFDQEREEFLREHKLQVPVSVRQAISDLETRSAALVECTDTAVGRFKQIKYKGPRTDFQRLLHGDMNGHAPNSLRLARHTPAVHARFIDIVENCTKGVSLSETDRERFGLKKFALTPLDPNAPSHTITTLPDDLLHYCEPRILTVRESARLQSFPDWYDFLGKYTTGGDRRKKECPRYTQVGNAVPPFVAEVIGRTFVRIAELVEGRLERATARMALT